MMHPTEALTKILARVGAPTVIEELPLEQAAGRLLARPALSDVDLPPFEKAMMDGVALRAADAAAPGARLRVVGESRAGEPFAGRVPPGAAIEIYTGAPLPPELDAVEMVERTTREDAFVTLEAAVAVGQHVGHTGEILARGRAALEPPRRLSPADLSVLASVGCDPVPVWARPRVSVLTTGDELVSANRVPGVGQIREGNTLYLRAAVEALGGRVIASGIVPDDEAQLERAFRTALADGDVLITTGGVSMGKYDLVGVTLEGLGVEPVLHKVAIKPGKPIWFGMAGTTPVFGLPGNPVSSLLGFETFVRPALAKLAGAGPDEVRERLEHAVWRGPREGARGRQVNLPAQTRIAADGRLELEPVAYRGSADIVGAARADALAVVPADREILPGDVVQFRPLALP
ncbi:MAG: gephyrin-like molybdotransferase Glp [Planctomycetota bacterium]